MKKRFKRYAPSFTVEPAFVIETVTSGDSWANASGTYATLDRFTVRLRIKDAGVLFERRYVPQQQWEALPDDIKWQQLFDHHADDEKQAVQDFKQRLGYIMQRSLIGTGRA